MRDGDEGAGFPRSPAELTTTWLDGRLRASGALGTAHLAGFAVEPVPLDRAMTGVLVRLRLAYDGPAPGAPATLVAKFASAEPFVRELVHGLGYYEREVRFYRELAALTPVPTPRCYAAEVDPADGTALLLLEDLAGAAHGAWVEEGASAEDLRLVLDAVAPAHARWWEDPGLAGADWLELKGPLAVPALPDMVAATWNTFLRRLTAPVDGPVEQLGVLLHQHLEAVARHLLLTPPRTLVHQDLDGANLFFPVSAGRRSVVVIDWQTATCGRAAVDLAWLLGGSCTPEVRRALEADLVAAHHGRLVELGVTGYPLKRFWDDYRLALLLPAARLAGAVGVLDGPAGGSWDVVFPRYATAVADLGVADLLTSGRWAGGGPDTV